MQRDSLTNLGGLLHVQPLAVVLQQELMAAGGVLQRDYVHCAWAVDAHACCGLHRRFHRYQQLQLSQLASVW